MATLVSVKHVESNGSTGVSLNDIKMDASHVHEKSNGANAISHTGENGTTTKNNGINGHNVQNEDSNTSVKDSGPSSDKKVSSNYSDESQGDFWTTKADATVRLRLGETEATSRPPITVNELLEGIVKQYPNRIALAVKRDEKWRHWTYSEYYEEVRIAAKSFIKVS